MSCLLLRVPLFLDEYDVESRKAHLFFMHQHVVRFNHPMIVGYALVDGSTDDTAFMVDVAILHDFSAMSDQSFWIVRQVSQSCAISRTRSYSCILGLTSETSKEDGSGEGCQLQNMSEGDTIVYWNWSTPPLVLLKTNFPVSHIYVKY